MKNLNRSRSLPEPFDVCVSKTAIQKLWRYLRLTDLPQFFHTSSVTDANFPESDRDAGEDLIPAYRQAGPNPLIADHLIPIQIHLTSHERGRLLPLGKK
jgi:hypothetical protein